MKVLFFIKGLYAAGGTEKMTTLLANYLQKSGHQVAILTLESDGEAFFKLNEGIQVHSLSRDQKVDLSSYSRSLSKYFRIFKAVNPDVVIDLGISNSLLSLPVTIFRKTKVISWEHFNTYDNWKTASSRLARWIAARTSYKVVVLTEIDRQHFTDKYLASNVICIPNPITLQTNERADMAAQHVLAIGRFAYQKGFDYLLDAWKIVTTTVKDWKLTIVGTGELAEDLMQKCKSLGLEGSVKFENPTKEISAFYKRSSVFVLSSRFEGLPLVLLEAKSFGLPVVSFNCKTGPDVIVRDKVDGFLAETGDVAALAEKLLVLMQDQGLREKFSANALTDKPRFEPADFYRQWDEVLESCAR